MDMDFYGRGKEAEKIDLVFLLETVNSMKVHERYEF
jgi:hypothetical protein